MWEPYEEVPEYRDEDAEEGVAEGFLEGDIVVANVDFVTNNQEKFDITKGTKGEVLQIDDDGDAQIKFDSPERAAWLFKKRFNLVKIVTKKNQRGEIDRLKSENARLVQQNTTLAAALKEIRSQVDRKNSKLQEVLEVLDKKKEKSDKAQRNQTVDAARNMSCGVFTAAVLSFVFFKLLSKGFSYAPGLIQGFVWFSMITCWVFLVVLMVIACLWASDWTPVCSCDDDELEEDRCIPKTMLAIAMLAAFFALMQFQFCLLAYAYMYPTLTEGVPFAKLDMVLDSSTSNMLNMSNTSIMSTNMSSTNISCTSSMPPSTLNKDLHWNIERVKYGGKSFISTTYGNQDFYLLKPEWVAILAHCAPVLAGLTYQSGIGALGYASLASLVIDFIDVQDFYLLLLEDDIAAGYWSRDRSPSTNAAGANFGIQDVAGHTYTTKGKLFEDDFQTQNVVFRWWYDMMLGLKDTSKNRNPYFNYWMWWRIMVQYVIASLYVCFLPFVSFLLQEVCCVDEQRCRARIQFLETILSLILIEIPFFWMRFAASQYFGVLMSSLCIKNGVSIVADILKIFLLCCGNRCDLELDDSDDCGCACAKNIGMQFVAFSNFIGEDVLKDTEEARKMRGVWYCENEYCCAPDDRNEDSEEDPAAAINDAYAT